MGFIEKISYNIAGEIGSKVDTAYVSQVVGRKKGKVLDLSKEECIQVIGYSLQAIIGEIVKIFIILSIAWLLGFFWEAFFTTIAFSIVRMTAGGVHMDSFERCLIATSIIILGVGYISSLIEVNLAIVLSLLLSILIITRYAPLGSEEKPLDTLEEKRIGKQKSLRIIVILAIVSFVFYILNIKTLSTALILGICLECLTITPIGVKIFMKLEKALKGVGL